MIADGYRTSAAKPIRLDGDNIIEVDKGNTVSGTVRTRDGDPVSKAVIEIQRGVGKPLVRPPAGNGESIRQRILSAAVSGWPFLYELETGNYIPGPANMPIP